MANLTPMIDVVFQLIIFFMLAAQFSSQQAIDLVLPQLDDPDPAIFDEQGRAVINLVPEERVRELGGAYRLGARSYADSAAGRRELASVLQSLTTRSDEERGEALRVVIRAGRIESYQRVHPLLETLTTARVREVDLAAINAAPMGGAR